MPGTNIKGNSKAKKRRSSVKSSYSAFQALHSAMGLMLFPKVGSPYLFYFMIQMLLLTAYVAGNSGPLASLWALPVGGISAEMLGHYPAHLLLLQPILERIEIFLDIILKSLFHGATVYLAARALQRGRLSISGAFTSAGRRYPRLLGVSLVSSVAVYSVIAIGAYFSSSTEGMARHAILGGGIAAGLVLQAVFVYAIPYVMIDGASLPTAIASGISLSLRSFTMTLLLVAIPFILTIPTTLIGMKAEMIALALSPDFMIHSHIASRVMEMISTYLVSTAAVVAFLSMNSNRQAGTGPVIGAKNAGPRTKE